MPTHPRRYWNQKSGPPDFIGTKPNPFEAWLGFSFNAIKEKSLTP
jgi:hypothetical protein